MTPTLLLLLAVFLRIVTNPLANVFQKQLTSRGRHPLLVSFLTYALLSVACLLISVFIPWNALPGTFWIYSVLGGVIGAVGNALLVKALQEGDLSVLGPINSYKSVVGIIAGIFLLGELPGIWGLVGMALIVWGSYFVLDTTAEKFSLRLLRKREIRYRVAAMVLTAIEAVFAKRVILASSATIAFISWCCFGALFSFVLMLISRVELKAEMHGIKFGDWRKVGLLILCIGIMQYTTNYVLARMQVGYALSFFQLSAILSVLLGYRFFRERGIRKKLVGSAVMITGSVVILLLEGR